MSCTRPKPDLYLANLALAKAVMLSLNKRIVLSILITTFTATVPSSIAEETVDNTANNEVRAGAVIAPQAPMQAADPNTLPAQPARTAPVPPPAYTTFAVSPEPQAESVKGPYVRVYEFGATWCPSCRKLKPVVHETMQKYKGFAEMNYMDTDKNQNLARQLNITSIPQVIIVDRRGRMLNRLIGYDQGAMLDTILTNYQQQIAAKQSQRPQ